MKDTISLLLVLPFIIFFMFQPFMTEVVNMRGMNIEHITDKYTKLSAVEGYLTPTLQNGIKRELADLHYDTSKLIITGTTSPVDRGSDIVVRVEYPIGNIFIFMNWFGSDSNLGNYVFTAIEMSEYIS